MISVVIPTLRERKLIERVLGQFTKDIRKKYNLEIIVSDGGSDDGTIKIAQQFADRVVTRNSDSIQTIASGRNDGAEEAAGDILCFINADTLISDPDKFFTAVLNTLKDSEVLAATCFVNVYPEEEKLQDKLFHGFCNRFFKLINTIGIGMGRGECHIIRKSVFHNVQGYNDYLVAGEDFELFSRIRRKGKIKFMNDVRVYESPRRYREFGYLRVAFDWWLNAVAVKILRRSVIKEWKPVR